MYTTILSTLAQNSSDNKTYSVILFVDHVNQSSFRPRLLDFILCLYSHHTQHNIIYWLHWCNPANYIRMKLLNSTPMMYEASTQSESPKRFCYSIIYSIIVHVLWLFLFQLLCVVYFLAVVVASLDVTTRPSDVWKESSHHYWYKWCRCKWRLERIIPFVCEIK